MRILYFSGGDPRSERVQGNAGLLSSRGHEVEPVADASLAQARAFRPDVILVRGIRLSVVPALLAARLGRPLVVELDVLLEDEIRGSHRRRTVRAAHRFTLARATRVVAPSPEIRSALVTRYGYPTERIEAEIEAALVKAIADAAPDGGS